MKIVCLIVIFLACVFASTLFSNAVAQTSKTSTYEGPYLGIKVQYPSTWTVDRLTVDFPECSQLSGIFCMVNFYAPSLGYVPITIHSYNLNDSVFKAYCVDSPIYSSITNYCENFTLKEFVRYFYLRWYSADAPDQVINDKPITILGNQSAWEMESQDEHSRRRYTLWTINNNTGYIITLSADAGEEYDKYLKEVKEMIGKIEFFPPTPPPPPPKVPSFMK